MSTLNGDQFFHGTRANVKGGMIRPANDVDRPVSEASMGDPGDMSEGDHAFAIRNDEHYAWHAALHYSEGGGRPKVFKVEPAADMKPGPWNKDHPNFLEHHELDMPEGVEYDREYHAKEIAKAQANHQDEWASPTGFKIKERIDTIAGRQGTFPSINWNTTRPGYMRGGDVNHPTDDQVRYGQLGEGAALAQAHKENAARREAAPKRVVDSNDWRNDQAPHSALREMAGRPQKRIATLFD